MNNIDYSDIVVRPMYYSKTFVIYHLNYWEQDGLQCIRVMYTLRVLLSEMARPLNYSILHTGLPVFDLVMMAELSDLFLASEHETKD